MKRNFQLVLLLTVFTLVLNIFSVLILMKTVSALTTDTMSSVNASAFSSHEITYAFVSTPVIGDVFHVTFPSEFDCTGLVADDMVAGSWAYAVPVPNTCDIELTAGTSPDNPIVLSITNNLHLKNPVTAGTYTVSFSGTTDTLYETMDINIVLATASDSMTSTTTGDFSNHVFSFEFDTLPEASSLFTITLPTASGFDCTNLVYAYDVTTNADWQYLSSDSATCTIVVQALVYIPSNPFVVTVSNLNIRNPLTPGVYQATLEGSAGEFRLLDITISNPVTSASGSDLMTSLKALTNSSHVITYVFLVAPTSGETFTVDFQDVNNDADGFDCTGLVNADVTLSSGWLLNGGGPADAVSPADCEVYLIADTAPSNPIVVTIASTHMLNPTNITSYNIYLSGSGETMTLQVPIVDSDTVDITGYISSSLSFDLDTTTLASGATYPDCDAISCLAYEGQTLTIPTNYTVDLGNLTIAFVNKSSSGEVLHADTGTGVINSIYFDLSTNAASGAVVTYKSLNGELRGPGHNTTIANDLDIPSVADGSTNITAGIAAYGIQMSSLPGYLRLGTGTQTVNCGSTVDTYCVMGAIEEGTGNNLQTAQPIYTTTGPIEKGRGKIDVAAAIDGTNVPGTYIDQITFIATSTF